MKPILSRFGVANAPAQFETGVIGRTLIMDGDAAAYKASAGAAKLETAIRRFTTQIYEAMYLTKATQARVHITPKGCWKNGRHLLKGVKPYQGNRTNKEKPPLLEPLREAAESAFADFEDIVVIPNRKWEADDGIMIDAYTIEDAVVWSEDKDLNIVPCTKYDIKTGKFDVITDRYGWIKEDYTPSGTLKIKGHGTKFFWAQMLMGDTADHVQGILKYEGKKCGARGAINALEFIESEDHAANLVINAYREIAQNPLPEAEALWLLRVPDDSALAYMWSLDLTERNREYLVECSNQDWKEVEDENHD